MIICADKREAEKGFGDIVPERVWAAAQRILRQIRKKVRIEQEPQATLSVPGVA